MIEITQPRKNRLVIIRIRGLKSQMNRGIRQGFYLLGIKLVKDTKKDILRRPRSGIKRVISTARRRRRHTASVPGEAPASVSGRLWRSLDFKVSGSREMKFGYDSTAESDEGFQYGKYWESEAPVSKLRPGLLINIEKNRGYGAKIFGREINRVMK